MVIYALENDKYKIKDSYGKSYEIPKNRCTFQQVRFQLVQNVHSKISQGFYYRLCDDKYPYEVSKIRSIFSGVDFNMATKSNLTEPKDWLLYDTGFVLKMKKKNS